MQFNFFSASSTESIFSTAPVCTSSTGRIGERLAGPRGGDVDRVVSGGRRTAPLTHTDTQRGVASPRLAFDEETAMAIAITSPTAAPAPTATSNTGIVSTPTPPGALRLALARARGPEPARDGGGARLDRHGGAAVGRGLQPHRHHHAGGDDGDPVKPRQ